jgi:hypothetical protein
MGCYSVMYTSRQATNCIYYDYYIMLLHMHHPCDSVYEDVGIGAEGR